MAFAGFRLSSNSKTVIETASSELAHISRVCLTEYDTPCKYMVQLEVEKGRPYCIGILSDRCPQIMLEHYIQNGSVVWLEGKGTASADLTGYIEPAYSFSDEDDEEISSGESDLEAADDAAGNNAFRNAITARVKAIAEAASAETDRSKPQKAESSPSARGVSKTSNNDEEAAMSDNSVYEEQANTSDSDVSDEADTDATKASTSKNASPSGGDVEMEEEEDVDEEEEDDEDEDAEDEEDEEEEDEDDEEDDDDGEDEEEIIESESEAESEVVVVEPKHQRAQTHQQSAKSNQNVQSTKAHAEAALKSAMGKKRKGEPITESAPAAKKKQSSGPEAEYERALVEELKRLGGRTKISILGAKIPRPTGLVTKLGAFLKERPSLFVCDAGNVELAVRAMWN